MPLIRIRASRRSSLAALALSLLPAAPLAAQCVDFDPPPAGAPWPCCGAVFVADGVACMTHPYEWPGGAMFAGGEATLATFCPAGAGTSLWLNNVNVSFRIADFFGGAPIAAERVKFSYADHGGNVNLRVNGLLANAADFHLIPAGFFAGAGVIVTTPPPVWTGSAWVGDVILEAMPGFCIEEFAVGGQELCIDDVCADPCGFTCDGDLDGDGVVGFSDLVAALAAWGPCAGCAADLDGDGVVGFSDVVAILAAWGSC